MARSKNPRSEVLKIRLTVDEMHGFRRTASNAGLPMSDLGRSMIIGVKPNLERRPRFVFHPVDPSLLRQVAGIGNNLNQVAAALNARSDLSDAAVLLRLIAIERAISDLVESNTHEGPTT